MSFGVHTVEEIGWTFVRSSLFAALVAIGVEAIRLENVSS